MDAKHTKEDVLKFEFISKKQVKGDIVVFDDVTKKFPGICEAIKIIKKNITIK